MSFGDYGDDNAGIMFYYALYESNQFDGHMKLLKQYKESVGNNEPISDEDQKKYNAATIKLNNFNDYLNRVYKTDIWTLYREKHPPTNDPNAGTASTEGTGQSGNGGDIQSVAAAMYDEQWRRKKAETGWSDEEVYDFMTRQIEWGNWNYGYKRSIEEVANQESLEARDRLIIQNLSAYYLYRESGIDVYNHLEFLAVSQGIGPRGVAPQQLLTLFDQEVQDVQKEHTDWDKQQVLAEAQNRFIAKYELVVAAKALENAKYLDPIAYGGLGVASVGYNNLDSEIRVDPNQLSSNRIVGGDSNVHLEVTDDGRTIAANSAGNPIDPYGEHALAETLSQRIEKAYDFTMGYMHGLAGQQGAYGDRSDEYKLAYNLANNAMGTVAGGLGKVVATAPPFLPGGRSLTPGMELVAGGAVTRTTVTAPSVPIYYSSLGNNNSDTTKSEGSSNAGQSLPTSESKLKHIFREEEGHLPDTPENRKLLQETVDNPQNYLGKDKYGNNWYAITREDGTQVWVQSRNGEIWDGGLNKQSRTWNDQTGLKNQQLPKE